MIAVSAFYKFVRIADLVSLRTILLAEAKRQRIRGTILLAPEGINGTIAGERDSVQEMMAFIRGIPAFTDLESKESHAEEIPFRRMKVRLKREIVTLGVPGVDPTRVVGNYVAPEDWNALISNPGVLVIDTRNSFEVEAGTFKGAINPDTKSFGEFPVFVERQLLHDPKRPIAMFCTGGIRCEKATSYLRSRGFENVFHLKGGILKYLETVQPANSLWEGACFVFDEREGLTHGLAIKKPASG